MFEISETYIVWVVLLVVVLLILWHVKEKWSDYTYELENETIPVTGPPVEDIVKTNLVEGDFNTQVAKAVDRALPIDAKTLANLEGLQGNSTSYDISKVIVDKVIQKVNNKTYFNFKFVDMISYQLVTTGDGTEFYQIIMSLWEPNYQLVREFALEYLKYQDKGYVVTLKLNNMPEDTSGIEATKGIGHEETYSSWVAPI